MAGTVTVLIAPPALGGHVTWAERTMRENKLDVHLRDWEEFALLDCETCGLDDTRCAALMTTARPIGDPDNVYFTAYARWHKERCPAYLQVHPWSFLFCSHVPGHERAEVRGPMLFVKRKGGAPGTTGAFGLSAHPGYMVDFSQEDVDHLFRHFSQRHVWHGHGPGQA